MTKHIEAEIIKSIALIIHAIAVPAAFFTCARILMDKAQRLSAALRLQQAHTFGVYNGSPYQDRLATLKKGQLKADVYRSQHNPRPQAEFSNERLFCHSEEYGDITDSRSKVSDMTGLERLMYEDNLFGSGRILKKELRFERPIAEHMDMPYWTEAGFSPQEATEMIEYLGIIGPTKDIATWFHNAITELGRTPAKALDWAADVANSLLETETVKHSDAMAPARLRHMGHSENGFQDELDKAVPTRVTTEFGYCRVYCDDGDQPHLTLSQVDRLTATLDAMDKPADLNQLSEIGAWLGEHKVLLPDVASDAWDLYRRTKAELERKSKVERFNGIVSETVDAIMTAKDIKRIKYLGAWLFAAFEGRSFNGSKPPVELSTLNRIQRGRIWRIYNARKRALSALAA
jgi:hypothetical protein